MPDKKSNEKETKPIDLGMFGEFRETKLQSTLLTSIPKLAHGFLAYDQKVPEPFYSIKQTHSADWIEASPVQCTGDALWSVKPARIAVCTADCIPLLVASTAAKKPFIAAIHSGWKGTIQSITSKLGEILKAQGIAPNEIVAAIGPHIEECCFEVGKEIQEALQSKFPAERVKRYVFTQQPASRKSAKTQATPRGDGIFISLRAIVTDQLIDLGIPAKQIEAVGLCTYCGNPEFASYRRATHAMQPTGLRQWSFVEIK